MNRALEILFVLLIVSFTFGQEPPPLCAAIDPPCFRYAPAGNCTLRVDSVCISTNPDGTRYQFWRHIVLSLRPEMEDTTAVIATDWYAFTGALDGETFEYRVRAIHDEDTSDWSPPISITHDIANPQIVPFLDATYYNSGDSGYVQLIWQRATDAASGVRGYAIYRSTNPADLVFISLSTPEVSFVQNDGSEMYCWRDYDVEPDDWYYYTVVPFDSAGVPCLSPGHFPNTDNIVEGVYTCCPPPPPCAILKPIPRFIETPSLNAELNIDACPPRCGMLYQFRIIDLTAGDTTEYPWTPVPSYSFSLEDCHRYIFSSRARIDDDTTEWYDTDEKICDLSGPGCIDSIVIEQEAISGGLDVTFWVGDECNLDCGAGLMFYRLYRVNLDSLDEFFPIDTGDYDHILWEYHPLDSCSDNVSYRYCDDCEGDDPVIDLRDGQSYAYIVVAFDSLRHWNYCASSNWDTATADKGVVPPMLVQLPTFSPCDDINCVTLQIVDTSQGDIQQIMIEQALDAGFTVEYEYYGPYGVDDPVFTHSGTVWDTLTFIACGIDELGLDEAQYYFRAIAYDGMDNISLPSNIVNSRFDCTPPVHTYPDSIHSVALCTDHLGVEIWWNPSTDYGIGVERYDIYRNDVLVASVEHNSLISRYYWLDTDPSPDDNYNANCYKIVPVDSFGNQELSAAERCFDAGTPPLPVKIDTVYAQFSGGEMWIVINWSDTAGGFGNRYRLEHAAAASWLCMPELGLVEVAGTTFTHTMQLPQSIIMGSPTRYFHIATIDDAGNESPYSEPFVFTDSSFAACTTIVHLYAGWNMISLPLIPRSPLFEDVFPSAIPPAYSYAPDGGIYPDDTLDFGWGYWVLSPYDQDVMIAGYCTPQYVRWLEPEGYYIIGSVVDTAVFCVEPDGAALPDLYWWNPVSGSYTTASEILPGYGYWLAALNPCTLSVPCGTFGAKIASVQPEWLFTIKAGTQELFIGAGSDDGDAIMPPAPPQHSIPSLLGDNDTKLIKDISQDGEWWLLLPDKCRVSWDSSQLPQNAFVLSGDGVNIDMHSNDDVLLPAGKYRISVGVVPKEFAVAVYPNPFNASTTIEVILPDESDASITVFSTDGKSVHKLYDGELNSGTHHFVWNGMDDNGDLLPAGIYLVKVSAGRHQKIERLLLVK